MDAALYGPTLLRVVRPHCFGPQLGIHGRGPILCWARLWWKLLGFDHVRLRNFAEVCPGRVGHDKSASHHNWDCCITGGLNSEVRITLWTRSLAIFSAFASGVQHYSYFGLAMVPRL